MSFRAWSLAAFALLASFASAQAPDVRVRLDALVGVHKEEEGPTHVRFYDALGNRGVLTVTFFLEPGFRTYFAQRLQQIENDPDKQPLDEYYVEDPGLWRVGKQYLPFGTGQILKESVLAARGDTNLIFEGLPVVVAACDEGKGRQRGLVARIGSRIGVSAAVGHHFGIGATSLNQIRRPEDSPGIGRGYRRVFGMDASRTVGKLTFSGEAVLLREGETPEDEDRSILDGSVKYSPNRFSSITAGLSRSPEESLTLVRLHGSFQLDRNLTIEPLVRMNGGKLYDAVFALRIRI